LGALSLEARRLARDARGARLNQKRELTVPVLARALCALVLASSLAGCVVQPVAPETVAVVRVVAAPPALPVYEQPPCPGEGFLWTPGYWHYGAGGYFWVPGTWVMPPRVGLLWTPGYWGFVGGAYVFHEGYWGPRVGYYGGINYGAGYVGTGYAGGRWVNNEFHYNTAVSNVNVVNVHNVYRETVVNNVTIVNNTTVNNTRVSYAGGPGGTTMQPTEAEHEAERAPHVAPTPLQVQHRDDARANPSFFAQHNQGHPPVAATASPSAFTAPAATRGVAPPAGGRDDRPHDDRPHPAAPQTMPMHPVAEEPPRNPPPHPAETHPAPPHPQPAEAPKPAKPQPAKPEDKDKDKRKKDKDEREGDRR
jgi:hypothetical protein